MKRLSLLILIAAVLFTACKKSHVSPPSIPTGKIAGRWNILNVTVVFRDSTGKSVLPGGYVYPGPADNYFKFNTDGTWMENLLPDSTADMGLGGKYILTSDTTFTLSQSNPNGVDVFCKIYSVSSSLFVFSHHRTIQPGSRDMEYIFNLTK